MRLRGWYGGGLAVGLLALLVLGALGAWKEPTHVFFIYCIFDAAPVPTPAPAIGWALLVGALAAAALGAWAISSASAYPGPPATRAADVCGALAVAAAAALTALLVGFATHGYALRPTLVELLRASHVSPIAPFFQVFGSLAWGVFLVSLAWRLARQRRRDPAPDRVAAALAGALTVIVGVCGGGPPYFMH